MHDHSKNIFSDKTSNAFTTMEQSLETLRQHELHMMLARLEHEKRLLPTLQ